MIEFKCSLIFGLGKKILSHRISSSMDKVSFDCIHLFPYISQLCAKSGKGYRPLPELQELSGCSLEACIHSRRILAQHAWSSSSLWYCDFLFFGTVVGYVSKTMY